MQRIEVVRNSDPLNREVWVFWYDDRHQSYERIGRRRGEDNISPSLPSDVSAEAAKIFSDSLKVVQGVS
jgi:hypothetical protein